MSKKNKVAAFGNPTNKRNASEVQPPAGTNYDT